MNKFIILALIAINSVYSLKYKCMDKLAVAPQGKCMVVDYLDTVYVTKCKTGLMCDSDLEEGDANWGQCVPVKLPGTAGQVCADNAECMSNNCANLACAEQPDETCSNALACGLGRFCGNDGYCQNIREYGAKCDVSNECPPYSVCNLGRCTKIGEMGGGKGASHDLDNEIFKGIVCENGIHDSGTCKKIVDEQTNYCEYDSSDSTYKHTVTFDDGTSATTECRTNLLTGAPYPALNLAKQYAFDNYKAAVANNPRGSADGVWDFKYNRIHGDNKDVKDALTAYLYPELADDGNEDAVCIRQYMAQVTLSSNKINVSKILILLFALFI
jgi:hypothetical protein